MVKEVEFHKKVLKKGLTVLFEKRNIPVVSISCSVKFGSEFEPLALKGISHFIEHLLFKGTKNRDVKQISEEVEKKGGILNAFTSEEITSFWCKLSSNHLKTGLDLCSDLVLNPLFDEKQLEHERKVILEEIKMYYDNPQTHVFEKIKSLMYKSPFGLPILGTTETMNKISRIQVVDLFKKIYSTNNLILCAVGKADFKEICEIGETYFPKTENMVQGRPIFREHGQLIEKRKGVDQANLILGYHAPSMLDKKRYAAELFDVILGRGMSSRLFQEIREKRGLAYSVRGMLEQDKNYGHELIYVGTTKDKVEKCKEIILKEIKKMKELDFKDFEQAKEQLLGLRKVGIEDSTATMVNLISEENAGNAEEHYKFEEKINKIKLKDVRELGNLKDYSFYALLPY